MFLLLADGKWSVVCSLLERITGEIARGPETWGGCLSPLSGGLT